MRSEGREKQKIMGWWDRRAEGTVIWELPRGAGSKHRKGPGGGGLRIKYNVTQGMKSHGTHFFVH